MFSVIVATAGWAMYNCIIYYCPKIVLFVCIGCLSQGRKEGILLGTLPHFREQKKCSYFHRPGQSQHLGYQESNPPPALTPSSHADPGRLEFSLPPWKNPGVRTAPGRTPGIVRTLCRPFHAFRWFPIHKPSSNSTIPVAWISEATTDFR